MAAKDQHSQEKGIVTFSCFDFSSRQAEAELWVAVIFIALMCSSRCYRQFSFALRCLLCLDSMAGRFAFLWAYPKSCRLQLNN